MVRLCDKLKEETKSVFDDISNRVIEDYFNIISNNVEESPIAHHLAGTLNNVKNRIEEYHYKHKILKGHLGSFSIENMHYLGGLLRRLNIENAEGVLIKDEQYVKKTPEKELSRKSINKKLRQIKATSNLDITPFERNHPLYNDLFFAHYRSRDGREKYKENIRIVFFEKTPNLTSGTFKRYELNISGTLKREECYTSCPIGWYSHILKSCVKY